MVNVLYLGSSPAVARDDAIKKRKVELSSRKDEGKNVCVPSCDVVLVDNNLHAEGNDDKPLCIMIYLLFISQWNEFRPRKNGNLKP